MLWKIKDPSCSVVLVLVMCAGLVPARRSITHPSSLLSAASPLCFVGAESKCSLQGWSELAGRLHGPQSTARRTCCKFAVGILSVRAVRADTAYADRFNGVGRLFGATGLERLRFAHVCVVGLGGVGSWAVEALARSGIGALTLVDLDEVCVSNTNRQLCALDSTIGKPKALVLEHRVKEINPQITVTSIQQGSVFDFVVDGIDGVDDKASLLAACVRAGVPAVTSGGAGGLTDPTAIRMCDLYECEGDPLAQKVRKAMRQRYGFPKGIAGSVHSVQRKEIMRRRKRDLRWGIPVFYSTETLWTVPESSGLCAVGEVGGSGSFRACDVSFGSSSAVTGAFGLALAAHVVKFLASGHTVSYANCGKPHSVPWPKWKPFSPSVKATADGGRERGKEGATGEGMPQ